MKLSFASFPSIEGFHNVVKLVDAYPHFGEKPVTYRGKIKLHGTNAGIRVGTDGEVVAQSRTQIITPQSDNAGFARWVAENEKYWKTLAGDEELTIFGEWCGPGIMKGTAINQIPNKIFAVFAIMVGTIGEDPETGFPKEDLNRFVVEPEEIAKFIYPADKWVVAKDVYILPWESQNTFAVNYSQRETLQGVVDALNAIVEKTEPCDPWVKSIFGVEGVAEGIVYYPNFGGPITRKGFSNFAFKAKGVKHKVNKSKEAVQVDPEIAASVDEFVLNFATEPRFEQGVVAVGGSLEMKHIGPFLKWVCSDIVKESVAELEASDLEWGQVQSAVQTTARNWFIAKNRAV